MSGISISVKAPNGQFKLTGLSSKTTYGELVTQITKNSSLSEGSFEILMGFPPKLITGTSSFTLETLGIKNGEGLTIRNKGTGGIVKGEGGFGNIGNLFGDTLIGPGGKKIQTSNALAGSKRIGVYFSAHWCGPCRQFTPFLSKVYSNMKQSGLPFELIFVSSDRDEKSFNEYFSEMPWLAIPFANRQLAQTLGEKYGVEGIPCLVILDGSGKVITTSGRELVAEDASGKSIMK
jgi:nucleoredoxin